MRIISDPHKMRSAAMLLRKKNKAIGFVPTMGSLHEGHLELVKTAKKTSDIVVVSVFVNPLQFGPKEDYKKYPRNIKKDAVLLKKLNVDILFYPDSKGMFPAGFNKLINTGEIGKKLCGASRPGHFDGVATVVSRLFDIVKPHIAFFGEKDFQQQVIIKKMVKDLGLDVIIKTIPTVREPDGLAKSSRNDYLSKNERKSAVLLSKALKTAKKQILNGEKNAKRIKNVIVKILKNPLIKVDYVSICAPDNFIEKTAIKGPALIALAAFVGKTRLIDNILIKR